MITNQPYLDVSKEFIMQRVAGGIQLIHPNHRFSNNNENRFSTVGELMQLPVNIYFLNSQSQVITMNDSNAEICGWSSAKNAVGKSLRDLWSSKYADPILMNDKEIMLAKQFKITEEYKTEEFKALSLKFPWFGDRNELLGIFGCSIILNSSQNYNLATALSMLINMNLLTPAQDKITIEADHPSLIKYRNLLSPREIEVLKLLFRCKTAKEIGASLALSYRTVEHYIHNIKNKVGVSYKSELIAKFTQQ